MNIATGIDVGLMSGLVLAGWSSYHTGKMAKPVACEGDDGGFGITGETPLYEEYEGRICIKLKLQGSSESKLTPGPHAIHIHETGNCEPFTAAKGHFDGNVDLQVNLEASISPGLSNHPYHLGDLPNVSVDENPKGSLYTVTSRVTLSDGLNRLSDKDGSAGIIHELDDKYLPDPPVKDAPGGPRIACGVIVKEQRDMDSRRGNEYSRVQLDKQGGTLLAIALSITGLLTLATPARAAVADPGEKIVMSVCVQCHRIEGKPAPRKTKKAPDLIWAGNKYQREWLVRWLQSPDFKHYPVGYDFRPARKKRHLALPAEQAKAVTDFLATRKDGRIKEGVMKPGTPAQLERGQQLYRDHGCQNCHFTPSKTAKGYVGGTSSTSFIKINERLNADWVYRFNQNPDDFVPDSGAYIPKPPLPDEDIYAITAYMMTLK